MLWTCHTKPNPNVVRCPHHENVRIIAPCREQIRLYSIVTARTRTGILCILKVQGAQVRCLASLFLKSRNRQNYCEDSRCVKIEAIPSRSRSIVNRGSGCERRKGYCTSTVGVGRVRPGVRMASKQTARMRVHHIDIGRR
jgi:hypothetical protein